MIYCETIERFTDLTVNKIREIGDVFETDENRYSKLKELKLVVKTKVKKKDPSKKDDNENQKKEDIDNEANSQNENDDSANIPNKDLE